MDSTFCDCLTYEPSRVCILMLVFEANSWCQITKLSPTQFARDVLQCPGWSRVLSRHLTLQKGKPLTGKFAWKATHAPPNRLAI